MTQSWAMLTGCSHFRRGTLCHTYTPMRTVVTVLPCRFSILGFRSVVIAASLTGDRTAPCRLRASGADTLTHALTVTEYPGHNLAEASANQLVVIVFPHSVLTFLTPCF